MFLEMSRALADQVYRAHDRDEARAKALFRRCLTRPPSRREVAAILRYHQRQTQRLQAGELQPKTVYPGQKSVSPELAAWTMAARAIMNLDETITKN